MQLIRLRLLLLVLLTSIGIGAQAPAAFAVVDAAAPPDAVDDAETVRSGHEEFLDLTFNDTDPDFDPLTITAPTPGIPTATAHGGTVTCEAFSGCSYISATGYSGADSFIYTISDGTGGTDTATVSLTVLANTPPTAIDDVLEATSGNPSFVHVTGNDDDPDQEHGDFLTLTAPAPDVAMDTANGTVTCADFGQCEYVSDAGYVGPDSFNYTVADDSGASDSGQVTITVAPNQPPEAEDDTYARGDDITLQVLANDFDPEDAQLEITTVTQPAHGTATITLEKDAIAYTQTSNFTATDSFTYTISDGHGGTDTATVTLQPCPALAPAIDVGGIVTSERWVACSALHANGAVGPTTTVFPPQGGTSALLTSGNVALAPGPNNSSGAGSDNGMDLRGAFDVSILRLDLSVPAGANCLSFDLAFQSEEFPEFVGSFNDGFLAELDASTWQLEGNEITAPLNFAFDPAGELVSVNSAFFAPERVITETGSQYDGSTPLLNVRTPVTPGPHVLYLSIFDAGDHILDSAAFVDRLVAGAAGPGGCAAGANEPPNAVNDSFEFMEDVQATLDVRVNDSDPDGHPLTITSASPTAQHGTVSCTAANCTYTPALNYFGPDSFTYAISDGHGGTDTATVSITVNPQNDPPNAVDDTLTTAQGVPGSVNVLANDFDVDGDTPLTIQSFTQGLHGTVTCAGSSCTYTPAPGYSGPDSFTYTISDGHGGTDVGTVAVTVASGNQPPVADDDSLTTAEDTSGQVNVLDGDTDPDAGDTLTVTTLTPSAAHGTVSCIAAGVCTYTPAANYFGPDSFTYTVSDGNGGTDTATVNVTVTPVNDDPNAVNDSLTTNEDTASAPLNVLANDTDIDGGALTVTTLTPTAGHGTVSCTVAGLCTYTPAANYNGPDSFTYSISDGNGGTDTATVNVTVTAVNDNPNAVNDSLTTDEDTAGQLNVLANDTDVDGDSLTVTTLNPTAAHGTVSCTAAGVCTYTPSANYHGSDSFTYSISDGHGGTDTATVSITVTSVNDQPDAVNDSLTTIQDTASAPLNVLANDTDVDGDTLTAGLVAGPTPQHGSVGCSATGVCTYTPNPGYVGPDSFTYSAFDGHGGTDTAIVSVTVTPDSPPNQPPVADDETLTTAEDTAADVNVLVGDADPDAGDTLTVTSASPAAAHGTVACTTAGVCTYTPAANYNGPDGFDYTISDGKGGTDTGHVTITVTPVNDPPVADDELLVTNEDTAGNVNVLAGDTDVDPDPLAVTTLTPSAAHGTVSCTAAGVCTYTPAANYNGPDGFDYTVSDGNATDTGHVSITVTPGERPAGRRRRDADDERGHGRAHRSNVLEDDTDIDGDSLTVTSASPTAAHGTVSCTARAGSAPTRPARAHVAPTRSPTPISDGNSGTDTGTVSVTVTPVAAQPDRGRRLLDDPAETAVNVNVLRQRLRRTTATRSAFTYAHADGDERHRRLSRSAG